MHGTLQCCLPLPLPLPLGAVEGDNSCSVLASEMAAPEECLPMFPLQASVFTSSN